MTRTILRPNVPREIVFNPQHHELFGTLIEAVACSVMLEIFSIETLPTRHEIAAYTELQEELTHVIEQLILQDLIKTSPRKIKWTMPSYVLYGTKSEWALHEQRKLYWTNQHIRPSAYKWLFKFKPL